MLMLKVGLFQTEVKNVPQNWNGNGPFSALISFEMSSLNQSDTIDPNGNRKVL